MARLLALLVIFALLVAVVLPVAVQLSANVRRTLTPMSQRAAVDTQAPGLGRGLWRQVFADCAADVTRFERVADTVREPSVRRWLEEIVPELRDGLQRVRALAELGQTLSPDPRTERDITNETASRSWQSCVAVREHFSRMADKAGAVAYELLGTPEVASIERQLRAIEEVVRDLRRATDDSTGGGD